jgi:hypothetical protein
MHKDFPQRGNKARNAHSVHKLATMEDMGRNVPMIYIMLDNK